MHTKEQQIELLITKYDLLYESRLSKTEATLDFLCKSIDTTVKELKADVRWMLGMMFGFGSILLGLMAKGFHWFV
jgi:hypothetical protein